MPLYTYRCPQCDNRELVSRPINVEAPGPICGHCDRHSPMKRDYRTDRPFTAPVWQSHFNPSTGTIVSDKKQMQSDMDRASESLYERTGIEQRNVVIDRADMKALKHQSADE